MAAYGCHHSIVCAARDRGNGMGVRERGGGEYPLLGYIDDITVLFDGKEAAPGDEFSDLDPEQTYVVSASYQSGDIAEDAA